MAPTRVIGSDPDNSGEYIVDGRSVTIDDLLDMVWSGYKGIIICQNSYEIGSFLKYISRDRPEYILEIGTQGGGTLFLLTKVAGDGGVVISIDLPEADLVGAPEWMGYDRSVAPIFESFATGTQRVHLIRANSHDPGTLPEVMDILEGNELDVLFIDGDHSYEGVKADYEVYGPLVRSGGIIAIHDILIDCGFEGIEVPEFWVEVRNTTQHFSISARDVPGARSRGPFYDYGIGVIIKE